MQRSILLIALFTATPLAANERGLDLSDPDQVTICTSLAALTQTMAEQAEKDRIPAGRTESYRKIKSDPTLTELADVIASVVDRLDGRLTPPLVRTWSMYGYCRGYEDDLLFGEAATRVGEECNSTPEGTESACIQDLLESTFNALSPEVQQRALEDARRRGY